MTADNATAFTDRDREKAVYDSYLAEMEYRREKQWRVFLWSSALLAASIGVMTLFVADASKSLHWPQAMALILGIILVTVAGWKWIKSHRDKEEGVRNDTATWERDHLKIDDTRKIHARQRVWNDTGYWYVLCGLCAIAILSVAINLDGVKHREAAPAGLASATPNSSGSATETKSAELLQALVWPATIVGLVFWKGNDLDRILRALAKRVEEGAPVKAWTVEIGSAPSLPPVATDEDPRKVDNLPHNIYMSHVAWRDATLDKDGREYYRLRIFLDADTPNRLNEVTAVTYHLHPSFNHPSRPVIDRQTEFELRTAAWGEFNMTAEITFKDETKLVVERYINLPGPVKSP
jgi:prokaryotic YEATS domain